MKTLDLRHISMSLAEVLKVARHESVLLLSEDGSEFLLESADAFDQEVAELGQSEAFMSFLAKRAQEPESINLDEFEKQLTENEYYQHIQPKVCHALFQAN
jgi:hypothetical protein